MDSRFTSKKALGLSAALAVLPAMANAQSYQCKPSEECVAYPEPCTSTAYQDEILKLDFSENSIRVEFEIYGAANIPFLAKDEQEGSTSYLMSVEEISIFATLYHTGELEIMLPSSVGGGNPALLRLTCEEAQ